MQRLTAALLVLWAVVLGNGVTFAGRLRWPNAVASTDFSSYVTGWWMVLHGQARLLYDQAAQTAAQRVVMGGAPFDEGLMAFLYPPYVAVAGVPLGLAADRFGEPAAYVIWTLANLAFAARLAWLCADELAPSGARACWSGCGSWRSSPCSAPWPSASSRCRWRSLRSSCFAPCGPAAPTKAALWLAVLAIKPQLLPAIVIWLVARRAWPVLRRGVAAGAVLAVVPLIALGPHVWADYFRHVHTLERFFAPGLPLNMVNVRGLLLRVASRRRAAHRPDRLRPLGAVAGVSRVRAGAPSRRYPRSGRTGHLRADDRASRCSATRTSSTKRSRWRWCRSRYTWRRYARAGCPGAASRGSCWRGHPPMRSRVCAT